VGEILDRWPDLAPPVGEILDRWPDLAPPVDPVGELSGDRSAPGRSLVANFSGGFNVAAFSARRLSSVKVGC
jgi:hypothetical protein